VIADPHLEIINSYYLNTLRQSQQSFFCALISGRIGVAFFLLLFFLLFFANLLIPLSLAQPLLH